MKTYIAFTKENKGFKIIAIEACNISEAYISLKNKGFKLSELALKLSSVSIDFVSCEKITQ